MLTAGKAVHVAPALVEYNHKPPTVLLAAVMAIPVLAPLSTSLTLFGLFPMPTSDEISVPAMPVGTAIRETSSRKTDRLLLLSDSVKESAELPPVAVTSAVLST